MKLKKYMTLFTAALSLGACSDDFLKEEMVATITQDYFNTEKGMSELITATYDAFRQSKQYTQGPSTYFIGVDNMTPAGATTSNYSASIWNSTGAPANNMDGLCAEYTSGQMLGFYPTINNCNRVIQTIEEGKAMGKYAAGTESNRAKAEAMFNRAYCIYTLNTFLGDVYFPRTYTSAMPGSFSFARESSESIYKQIISDLRYGFKNLPTASEMTAGEFGRATKGAAAHFLAKLYLYREMGKKYGTGEYGRKADGTIDNTNPQSYLGMLYKGTGTADLDSCIYFCNYEINQDGHYELAKDYGQIFKHKAGDFSDETNPEIVFSCVYGYPATSGVNGRYGNRLQYFLSPAYMVALWGIPETCCDYPYRGRAHIASTNDFGFDIYTDKTIDSRFQKSFWIEMETARRGTGGTSAYAANLPYYAYNDPKNATYVWTNSQATYFNDNILPTYDRASWGNRRAVAGEHRMGSGDLAYAYLENTKATAIDKDEAESQPYFLFARWIKKDGKYYYRATRNQRNGNEAYLDITAHGGLNSMSKEPQPATRKYDDPDRPGADNYYSGRDIPIFRIAEAYLMRANAYGLKGDYPNAILDINQVRERAAYHPGESRAEIIARLYPGKENLLSSESKYPYTVAQDYASAMKISTTSWDGTSTASTVEMYPGQNILGGALNEADRFQNFMLNEIAREFNMEMVYYDWLHHSGWQYMRMQYHNKEASTLTDGPAYWPVADNEVSDGALSGRAGLGFLQPYHTLKPFKQATIDLYTDENNKLLDEAGKKAYQNYGY